MPLVAHLCQDFLLPRGFGQGIAFVNVMRQRLLGEGRLAQVDSADGGRRVVVVRRRDQHHVDLGLALIEHLAVVVKHLWRGLVFLLILELLHRLRDGVVVNVGDGDKLFAHPLVKAVTAHAPHADDGYPQQGPGCIGSKDIGRPQILGPKGRPGKEGSPLKERAARGLVCRGVLFVSSRGTCHMLGSHSIC